MLIPGSNLLKLLLNVYQIRENDIIRMPADLHDKFINRAILTSKNIHVAKINEIMLNYLDGDIKTYLSCDVSRSEDAQTLYTPDFLNSIDNGNLPPHKLDLKVGCPIMVLRNIKADNGLCNGTRCIILALYANFIKAIVSTGSHVGKVVFIHRIKVKTDEDDSVVFTRTQFPVRLAFAMTINKAQGQTMNSMCLYLPEPVFHHGQLYVALSRVKKPSSVKVLLDTTKNSAFKNTQTATRNVVFTEVLQ